MANKKRFVGILALLLVLGVILMSCASSPASSLLSGPHPSMSSINAVSEKTGTASSTVIFGFGKATFPTITEAANNGGITKIATVEYYSKQIFLTFVVEYTTIVTGE
jgi:O-antigen/teichoic acid export membrane protein